MHILVQEKRPDGTFPTIPEDPGLPVMVLYVQRSVIKLRKQTSDTPLVLLTFAVCIVTLYQGTMRITERLTTTEWAMIGSLGNDASNGEIPIHYRLPTPSEAVPVTMALNLKIRDFGLKTQNYDKGLDRFVRTFNPDEEMTAIMSLYKGHYHDDGSAVCIKQNTRRCCHLDMTYGLTDEEALWTGLSAWATFQPLRAKPLVKPGKSFYPNQFSHVFEKSWEYLIRHDQP
jgi:hypothetical protein